MILDLIQGRFPQMSEAKRRIAARILDDWQEVAFWSVTQLSRAANVSESVVVRFANDLGFDGYPQLQDEIRGLVKKKLGLVDMYQLSAAETGDQTRPLLDKVMAHEANNLVRTLQQLNPSDVDRAVEMILGARRIVLLATRSSSAPAVVLSQYLNSLLGNVYFCTNALGELYDQLRTLDERDLAIAISFAWYTRQTISAMEFCRERKVKAIAITDGLTSPLARLSDVTLACRAESVSFHVSQVATLGVVNALLYLVASRAKQSSVESLRQMDEVYARYYTPPEYEHELQRSQKPARNDK